MPDVDIVYRYDEDTDTWTAYKANNDYIGEELGRCITHNEAWGNAMQLLEDRRRAEAYEECARKFELALFGEHPDAKRRRKMDQWMMAMVDRMNSRFLFPIEPYIPSTGEISFRRFKDIWADPPEYHDNDTLTFEKIRYDR